MAIGEKMRKWRSFRRMTMPQLSEATGIPASTIYLWEKNRLTPSRQEVGAIAHALGVSVSEIAGVSRDEAAAPLQEIQPDPPLDAPNVPNTPNTPKTAAIADPQEARNAKPGGAFDMMLVTEIYHYIRDEAENASLVELTTARNLFQESLKIIKERIKELNDYKKATGRK